jgi:simple sugar transport system substrate-binding protein
MMNRRSFHRLLGSGLALGAAPALIRPAFAAVPKVGFIYVGPIGDFGWSYQHDVGRKAIEAALGDKVQTSFVESVKEGPDSERVIAKLATDGCSLIFTTSFGFMNPTAKVAKRFPKVFFEHCTGYTRGPNLATYNIRFYEGRYIQGVITGKLSRTGTVGYIGSVPIPEVIMGMNAFLLGMKSVNPNARLKFIFINSWYDPGKEGDAAKALADQGCDILAQHTDSPAPLQVAESRGLFAFGEANDMIKFAPKAQLTSSINNWGPYYVERTKAAIAGTWKTGNTWGGLKSGLLVMAPYRNMPPDAVALAKQTEDGIRDGKITIFKGPLMDQAGTVKAAEGKALDDHAIESMDWLLEGIEGKLPK